MPTDAQVDKALELIQKGGGNYEYFFGKLSDPAWIGPLSKRGRFNHPPPIERVGNMFRLPRWPGGRLPSANGGHLARRSCCGYRPGML